VEWFLEVTGDLEMLVNVNFTEFSCGRNLSRELGVRSMVQ